MRSLPWFPLALILLTTPAFAQEGDASDEAEPTDETDSEEAAPTADGDADAPAPAEEPAPAEAAAPAEGAAVADEAAEPAPAPASEPAPEPEPEPAPAAAPAPAPVAEEAPPPVRGTLFTPKVGAKFEVTVSGKYAAWILNQHGFLLGQDVPLDDADYVVHMLRTKVVLGTPNVGAVARLDAGQGWWGADNNPDTQQVAGTDAEGNVANIASYNTYKLFGNKDTNYAVHFDHVYGFFEPDLPVKLRVQIGRQYYGAGHKLVLDQDYDGVQVVFRPLDILGFTGSFAVLSEGVGSYKNPVGLLMSDDGRFADALLAGGSLDVKLGPMTLGAFGYHYWDKTDEQDSSFLPQGVGYLVARFQPNITTLTALGITLDGKLDVLGGLSLAVEADALFGTDATANADHAGGLLDINDGRINGWNAYLKVDQAIPFGRGAGVHPGFTMGVGSGDDDPTSGRGNVNKIQTMGFLPLTNVWEDSVMPDIAGISPQGLGSPVSRGYREFENTLALQPRVGVVPWAPLRFDISYTFLRAIQPIFGWDATGTPTATSSREIGHEVDVNATVKILPKVTWKTLFGVFLPGEGAALLITGDASNREAAWEVKQVVSIGF